MENSSKYFCNKECEYFPCHENIDKESMNCLFCYCPMYKLENCPGSYSFVTSKDGEKIKDCSGCIFPHIPENYDIIVKVLGNNPS